MDRLRHRRGPGDRVLATRLTPMPTRSRRALVEPPRAFEGAALRGRPIDLEAVVEELEADVGIHFIEVVLLDEDDRPVAGERYRLTLPDGTVRQGSLDANGRVRIDRLKQGGTCEVTFPNLDGRAWERIAG